jgi:hypothetical protein
MKTSFEKKKERLLDLAGSFTNRLKKLPADLKAIPDITEGDDLQIENYEGKPETQIYLSNQELNDGGDYFAYANLSLSKNKLYINLEFEMSRRMTEEGKDGGTMNGSPAAVIKELKKYFQRIGGAI